MRGVTAAVCAWSIGLLIGAGPASAAAQGGKGKPAAQEAAASALKNPVKPTAESVEKGRAAFFKNCRHCHGAGGKGDGPLAPKDPPPANLTDAKWDHGASDGDIYTTILNGVGGKSEMKGYKSQLTPTDIWNIVNFLRSIGPKS